MAEEPEKKVLRDGEIAVSEKTLTTILENQAKMDKDMEDLRLKNQGLEDAISEKGALTVGGEKLRERKNFDPAFRTVTMKKYPMKGDPENLGIVIGWSNRGAYQKVDKSGVSAQYVDYIDVFFLGHERDENEKLQAESVPLLSLMGAAEVTCKVLQVRDYEGNAYKIRYSALAEEGGERPGERKVRTGEEVKVTTWDPRHGLVETGETIDAWVAFTDLTFVIQIPGINEPVEVDAKFLNI